MKVSLGLSKDEIIEAELYRTFLADIDEAIINDEKMLRKEMNKFTEGSFIYTTPLLLGFHLPVLY